MRAVKHGIQNGAPALEFGIVAPLVLGIGTVLKLALWLYCRRAEVGPGRTQPLSAPRGRVGPQAGWLQNELILALAEDHLNDVMCACRQLPASGRVGGCWGQLTFPSSAGATSWLSSRQGWPPTSTPCGGSTLQARPALLAATPATAAGRTGSTVGVPADVSVSGSGCINPKPKTLNPEPTLNPADVGVPVQAPSPSAS